MTEFEKADDFVKRAAELRRMAKDASSFAAVLLLDLAEHYDRLLAGICARVIKH
ncbi:hypothetical protein [Rhodoplanes sp. Z2-YC6860]|uniref:hypothetical protein n=1 Tax=Rhodoplanes sp. Z2-YC6860 TaxID=674703 RepID=UPI0012ECFD72|nr:hypothetical protein [Rhodoplanes sp. Z2-YC6860]